MSKRILIADDDPQVRRLLCIILERSGFAVIEAESGFTVLRMLEQGLPDLFILDLMMPGMDGFRLCKTLRELPATASIPIILLSANPGWRLDQSWTDVGANDFLNKSTPPAALVDRIWRLLDANAQNAKDSRNAV